MAMLRLKSCPRCRGDVIVDRDFDGWYEQCLQCGYQRYLEGIASAEAVVRREGKVAAYAGGKKK
jgi:hypothetical protein